MMKLIDGFADLHRQFGDIVKLRMANIDMVLVFNADDIQTMFQKEGKLPQRPSFEALKACRKAKYDAVGIVPEYVYNNSSLHYIM